MDDFDKIVYCPHCGSENREGAAFCSSCGKRLNEQKKKKPIWLIVLGALAVIGFFIYSRVNYVNNCIKAVNSMMEGAKIAESAGGMVLDVWHDSIWNTDNEKTNKYTKDDNGYFYTDFNDALSKYVSSDEYGNSVNSILSQREEATKYMRKIRRGVPKKHERLYSDIEELYDTFVEFSNLAMYFDGSYNSVLEKFNELDDKIVTEYRKVCSYFE